LPAPELPEVTVIQLMLLAAVQSQSVVTAIVPVPAAAPKDCDVGLSARPQVPGATTPNVKVWSG